MRMVLQRTDRDCGVAVLAMATDATYEDAMNVLVRLAGDFDVVDTFLIERYLDACGFWLQRRYERSADWPPKPWAPAHIAAVRLDDGRTHYVAMDAHGVVHDPLHGSVYVGLDHFSAVYNVVGVRAP